MKSLEDVFKSEFRNEVSNIGYKDIYKIPLPEVCEAWGVSGTELYAVKGIIEPYYENLNKKIVKRLPKSTVAKRRVIDKAKRSFLKDGDGNFVYEDYTVPTGSIVVVSEVKIELPFKSYKRPSKEGYGYIDFVQTKKGTTEYLYVLPESVLYKVNQTALALSVKNMKNFSGSGYMTWLNGMIFLHIIPYKPNSQYDGTRILKTGYSLDYREEVKTLLDFWQSSGVIPNIALCALSDGTNLAMKGTVVGYDSYTPVESLALSDKKVFGSDEYTDLQ